MGIDLAWGRRAPSGVCAVAGDGAVVDSATLTDDDGIVAWTARHAPAVVGFDAPLVVTNATGRRRCEALLSKAFGPERAGCYPSNLSLPAFSEGGRAAALVRRMGLETDPTRAGATGRPLAVEVYPHSALVALFALEARLAYKAGRGRSVEARASEMGRLVGLIEALEGTEPPLLARSGPRWAALAAAVGGARRHADLERVEDELDAHVCAHVARCLAADLRDGGCRVQVLGDWSEGAIVTPVDDRHRSRLAGCPAGPPRARKTPGEVGPGGPGGEPSR